VNEFACECSLSGCNGKRVAHMPLVLAIQECVDHFAAKYETRARVNITGPNRCSAHNKAVGGAPHSTHVDYIAADHNIELKQADGSYKLLDPKEQYDYYDKKYPNSHGIGIYSNRVHLDTRMARARW